MPQHRTKTRRLTALLGVWTFLACAAPARAVDLEGTWYVLVHYQDSATANPEAWRWEDRLWTFEQVGADRIRWTDHPIVVFDDSDGRFENLGGNRASRTLRAWEPDAGQLADIRDGLQVNSRGKKSKALRRQGPGSWASGGSGRAATSFVTYNVNWTIEDADGLPLFALDESLGSGASDSVDGRTEYRTEEVRDGVLHGGFARDDHRRGRFRMMRSGGAEKVRGSGKTQSERMYEMFASQYGLSLSSEQLDALMTGEIEPGTEIPDEVRADVRSAVRDALEQELRDRGESVSSLKPQIDSLTRQIERLLLDEGKSTEEVREMLRKGEIRP